MKCHRTLKWTYFCLKCLRKNQRQDKYNIGSQYFHILKKLGAK